MKEKEDEVIRISQKEIIKYKLYEKICCWLTLIYNIGEGISSIILGERDSSISLIAFGVQCFIETASSILVLFRFAYMESYKLVYKVPQPSRSCLKTEDELKQEQFISIERNITIIIGVFFLVLSIVIIIVSSLSLYHKNQPDTTILNIIISSTGLVFTLVFWKIKKKVSQVLNSSSIAEDAACNLACIKLTFVMLIGSLFFTFWKDGWWVDSSIAIILSCFFIKEGIQVMRWGLAKNFTGGRSDSESQKVESCLDKRSFSYPTPFITDCKNKELNFSTQQNCQIKKKCATKQKCQNQKMFQNKFNYCQNESGEKQTEIEQDLEQKRQNSNYIKNVDDNSIQDNFQQIIQKMKSRSFENSKKQSIDCQTSI